MDYVKLAGEFAKKYPTPEDHPYGHDGPVPGSWSQMCGNLMNRFGEFSFPDWAPRITGPNAWNVGLDSGHRNTDASEAPAGAVHWWRNDNATGFPGHTGSDLVGGGRHVFMATDALEQKWGVAIGTNSAWGYSAAKPFMEYMGWTTNYAGTPTVVAGSSPAGSITELEEIDMAFDEEEKHFLNGGFRTVITELAEKVAGVPAGVWGKNLTVNIPATKTTPAREVKGPAQVWFLNMSNAIGQQNGQIAGLTAALKAIGSGQPIDLKAITAAAKAGASQGAEEGAGRAFDNLTVTLSTGK